MSKKFLTLAVALALVMVAAAFAVSPARADDDDDDDGGGGATPAIAFGDFTTNFAGPPQHVDFNAQDGGLLGPDSGSITYTNFGPEPDFTYTAELVCVSIVGNVARFGYVIPPGTNMPGLTGTPIVWQVQDNGPEGSNLDQAGWIIAAAESCDVAVVPMQPITSGDIVVQQAGVGGGGDDDDDDGDDDDDDEDDDDDDDEDEDEEDDD